MKKIDICGLCKNSKTLKKSHIIPKFVFKKIKTDKNSFIIVSSEPNKKIIKFQKEFREHLLCEECENRINQTETYVANILYNVKKFYDNRDGIVKVYNVDYSKFKLFQLSILWRSSISNVPFFQNCKLSHFHQETLRDMIFTGDPGEEYEYGCIMYGLLLQGKMEIKFMMNPGYMILRGHKFIYHTFGGFRWNFIISKNMKDFPKNLFSIRKNNELVFSLKDMFEFSDISSFLKRSNN